MRLCWLGWNRHVILDAKDLNKTPLLNLEQFLAVPTNNDIPDSRTKQLGLIHKQI